MKYNFFIILIVLFILFYFTCSKKKTSDDILYEIELKSIKKQYNRYIKTLPNDYKKELKNIIIELSEDKIGYCKNKSIIGVYRSYGKVYKIPQFEVLIHEMAHILNVSEKHDEEFWNIYNYLYNQAQKNKFL